MIVRDGVYFVLSSNFDIIYGLQVFPYLLFQEIIYLLTEMYTIVTLFNTSDPLQPDACKLFV